MCIKTGQRGISLIELIMFIVIVSTALAGILSVMNVTTRASADPLVHKQALAIAESLLEEIELMPFTFCDPDDPAAGTATGVGDCAMQEVPGVENDVSRYDAALPFDNVSDYNGFAMNGGGIFDITDGATKIPGLDAYSLGPIVIAPIAFGGITLASGGALQITVTVTGPDGVPVTVDGVRTRYAPRAVP
jgi:MSHA pilin protein MshD